MSVKHVGWWWSVSITTGRKGRRVSGMRKQGAAFQWITAPRDLKIVIDDAAEDGLLIVRANDEIGAMVRAMRWLEENKEQGGTRPW